MNPAQDFRQQEALEALLDSTLNLLEQNDQQAFMKRLVERAAQLLDTPDAYLYLVKGEYAEVVVALGSHLQGYRLQQGQGVGGMVWQSGQSLLVEDYDTWSKRAPGFPFGVLRSSLGVPIKLGGQVWGVLGVTTRDPERHFGSYELGILERFVAVAALALKHYRLAQDLAQERDKASQLVGSLSETIIQTDAAVRITYVNPAWEELTGFSIGETLGRPYSEFLYPTDRAQYQELTQRNLEEQIIYYETERCLQHKNGEPRWVRAKVNVLYSDKGELVQTNGIFTDLTEQKKSAAALRQSQNRSNQLLSSLAEAVVESDRKGIVTYVNPAWTEMTGFREIETVGRRYLEFVHEGDHELLTELVRVARDTGLHKGRLEYRVLTKDGRFCWVNSQGSWLLDAQGQMVGLTGVLTNIQERKEAEQAILDSRERYRELVEGVEALIWEGSENQADFISARSKEMLGYEPEEWLRTPGFWASRIHPDDKVATLAKLRKALQNKRDYQLEYRFVTKCDKVIWLRDVAKVIQVPGQPLRLRGFTFDITQQKQTELELAESEARYALAVRGANDGIWDWDLRTGTIHVSARYREMLGLEAIAKTYDSGRARFEAGIHPDDRERVVLALDEHLGGKTPGFSVEFRLRHATHTWRWVALRGVARFDDEGQALRMAGSLTDISERGSYYDQLTNLPGRSLFNDRLERAIGILGRDAGFRFAVLFLDLDRFKVVNDSLGHLIGDQMLMEVARRLELCLRPGDTVARLGGDEFVILLEQLAHDGDAYVVAERIRDSIGRPFNLSGHETYSGASIGIVGNRSGYANTDDYLRAADTAMYQAKGSNLGIMVYDEHMHKVASQRLETEAALRRAIENNELHLVYQPIVTLSNQEIKGIEALVRWKQPRHTQASPAEFIPIAEETGLIIPLGEWVLKEACRQLIVWNQMGYQELHINVNIASRQIGQPQFAHSVASVLSQTGLDPRWLHLEITEGSVVEAADFVLDNLNRLGLLGVHLGLDDFGTGYSSLSYLRKLPIDTLKLDRSFVSHEDSEDNRLIVEAVVQMAKALNLKLICEGIETPQQALWLRELGCDYGQGYWFSKPLSSEAMTDLLQQMVPARA